MDAATSMKVIDALRANRYRPRSYSGRGMFGKQCIGVTVSRTTQAMVNVCRLVDDAANTPDGCGVETDALGLDTIVYWPNLPWPDDEPDTDEDD